MDAASLQQRNDGLESANQQLSEDAVGNKAFCDSQTADNIKLQVSIVTMNVLFVTDVLHVSCAVITAGESTQQPEKC